MKHSPLATVKR